MGRKLVKALVRPGREGVEDVAAIELSAGDEIERSDEEADPAGDQDGVGSDVVKGRGGGIPLEQEGMEEADGEGLAAEADDGHGGVGRGLVAEGKAHGDGDGGGHVAGQRAVDADVHQRVAVGNAVANLDDGAGGAAEGGGGKHPGEGGADLVAAAGEVVAELVDQQDTQKREGEGEAGLEHLRVVKEPAPGPKVAVADDGRQAFNEVLHEAGAVGGGGENADGEQEKGNAVFAEVGARRGFGGGLQTDWGLGGRAVVGSRRAAGAAGSARWSERSRPAAPLAGTESAWGALDGSSTARGSTVVQGMEFFSRFETDCFAGGDTDFSSGAGIAADPGFACADAEDAKSAQFDALSRGQSLFEALENRIHGGLCLGSRQAGALDNVMDDVLLNQRGDLAGATGLNVLRLTVLMLQVLRGLGNNRNGYFQFFL